MMKVPESNYHFFVEAMRNKKPARMPIYEHKIDDIFIENATGIPMRQLAAGDLADKKLYMKHLVDFWQNCGFDTVSYSQGIPKAMPGSGALRFNSDPCITDPDEMEAYPWDKLEDWYFEKFSESYELFTEEVMKRDGIRAVGGPGNGIFEMLPTWFSSIESPDVILLHLGTNDSGADTLNTMARTTALLDRLFAMQPSAHVFVSTLMWRNDATRYARIQTYNSNLTNVVAAQVAKGQKISIVDMHAAVPGGDEFGTVNFGDGLHPNTTGYALMAEAWRSAVEELYPDPENFTTTNAPAVVTATVNEATRSTITLRLNTAVTQASAGMSRQSASAMPRRGSFPLTPRNSRCCSSPPSFSM